MTARHRECSEGPRRGSRSIRRASKGTRKTVDCSMNEKTKLESEKDSLARTMLYTQEGVARDGATLVLLRWLPGVASLVSQPIPE